jgi:hypothetical protein
MEKDHPGLFRESPMKHRIAFLFVLVASYGIAPTSLRAAVFVLVNRSAEDVQFTVVAGKDDSRPYKLAKGDVLAVPLTRGLEVDFTVDGKSHRCLMRRNEIYCFIGEGKDLRLKQVGFTSSWRQPANSGGDEKDGDDPIEKPAKVLLKIPVKILVDQAEPTVQNVWEKRLRQRLADASDILERCCRIRLEVVEVGTWQSDEKLTKLRDLMGDFRNKVTPGKARLAIGFTGLPAPKENDDKALGCTPGPLQMHILIREYRPRTEAERLEVLVHELGHFLGACHVPDPESAMRAKLGDGKANLRSFRLGYDPLNTLVMNLVAEELAQRPVRGLGMLTAPSRRRLLDLYSSVARSDPEDPAAAQFVRMLGATPPEPLTVRSLPAETIEGARAVVVAVTAEAKRLSARDRGEGDALMERYCRIAAESCRRLQGEHAATAYTLGLAVAIDRSSLLRSLGMRGIPWTKLESDSERAERLGVLGVPTMHGSASLAQSFAVSAAVQMLVEGQAVSAAGLQEELLLRQGGDRFRFDELAASLGGLAFATQLDASPSLLDDLAKSFRVADYVLPPKGLPESVDRDQFARQYGSTADERFLEKQDVLRKRLLALPGYQSRD